MKRPLVSSKKENILVNAMDDESIPVDDEPNYDDLDEDEVLKSSKSSKKRKLPEQSKKPNVGVKRARGISARPSSVDETDQEDVDYRDDADVIDVEDNGTQKIKTLKEAGHILRVDCENFMCHRKFTAKFGRHMNFITGRNGSGKSAIVSAVQLCLGATARTTGRGTNLGSFIREGSDGPAIAQVTLLNEGLDAYKPEVYGSRIVIERKITKSGVSSYTLYKGNPRDFGDKVAISAEKKEVDAILRNFNIYIDNPCCVLTQEEAKKFVNGQDQDKYDFFLKATGLARTKEELKDAKQNLLDCGKKKEKYEEDIQEREVEVGKLKEELELWSNFDEEDNKIKQIRAQVFWATAYESERKLRKHRVLVKKGLSDLEENQQALQESQAELDKRGTSQSLTTEVESFQEELEVVMKDLNAKTSAVNDATRNVNTTRNQIKTLSNWKRDNEARLVEIAAEVIHEVSIQLTRIMHIHRWRQCDRGLLRMLEEMKESSSSDCRLWTGMYIRHSVLRILDTD